MKKFIAAIDQGTTSTRCILFDHAGIPAAMHQLEHAQLYPQAGWVEHDPIEIWNNTGIAIQKALLSAGARWSDIAAVGITNQRETTVAWDRISGQPLHNAIVWMDTRTSGLVDEFIGRLGGADALRAQTGLPLSTYFSAFKMKWLIDNVSSVQDAVKNGTALFGTIDSWLIWNLTGGAGKGVHLTDVTNASRTLLMDLAELRWNAQIAKKLGIDEDLLPQIRSCSEIYGYTCADGPFGGAIPISGVIGDQQAATVGQACLCEGDAKNTYGTGCFLILNTGPKIRQSSSGLLSTVCYKFGNSPANYALEGSVAIAGALVQWLRDNLGIIRTSQEIEGLARSVPDNGGIYFVPAFSGLFAPHWKSDARGVIVGMTRFTNRGHIARAALEATAYQTRDMLEAMIADSSVEIKALKVDGGMVCNELLMQFQADVLGVPLIRPKVTETTALGAAYAAGLAVGYWKSEEEIRSLWMQAKSWTPNLESSARTHLYARWKKALTRTFDWAE